MFIKKAHSIIPASKLLRIVLILSLGMQLIIMSQMYFFKNELFGEPMRLLIRMFRGTILSFIAGLVLVYPYLFLITYLNKRFPWKRSFVKRFIIQFFIATFAGLMITPLIVIPAGMIFAMEYDLQTNINNAYYIIILSLFLMTILEAMIYFQVGSAATVKAENLEKELSQIRFEVLKSQINPHFMFNSLNVLSGLVDQDVSKAQQFIDEFSSVYRYVLETIEQPVVSLNKELDFTRSYLFLQQIRYGENLSYNLSIPSGLLAFVLPPLSLQVVLENITKHNLISESKPLQIEIYNEGFFLIVKNNIQAKIAFGRSTGLGLKNLVKRYAFISALEPTFRIENHYYVAKLPLININDNERTNHRG
jgi:LytS/YehU family sensor histidine kinase